MKKVIVNSLVGFGLVFSLVACGSTSDTQEVTDDTTLTTVVEDNSTLPVDVTDAIDAPVSKISQELLNTIAYMGNEERLAYDVYNYLFEQYGTKQFTNIATNGEYQHITAVQELVQKYALSDDANFTNIDAEPLGYHNTAIEDMEAGTYDISHIQELYDALTAQGSTSEIEAMKVGCIIEVVDVNDLDEEIELAESENADDIVEVFNFLRDGSYNHYWAFDKGLKNMGVSEGCCSLGTEYCKTAEEYPSSH